MENPDEYSQWWTWVDRLDEYFADKMVLIEYEPNLSKRQKEMKMAYTEWAINELCDRLLDVCEPNKDFNEASFIIIEDFMWEMMQKSICYGQKEGNGDVEMIFDCAVEVAEEIGSYYFSESHGTLDYDERSN